MNVPPGEIAYQKAHIHESRVTSIEVVFTVGMSLSVVSTILRFYARRSRRLALEADDFFVVAGTLCTVATSAAVLIATHSYGWGRHSLATSFSNMAHLSKMIVAFQFLLIVGSTTSRISLLLLYIRIFVVRTFRWVAWATIAVVSCAGVVFVIAYALQCIPMAKMWEPTRPGRCINFTLLFYFTAAWSIVADVWLFLLPLAIVLRLQVSNGRKTALSSLFIIGLCVCVATVIRTYYAGRMTPFDFSWNAVPLISWAYLEVIGSVLCANLPVVYPVILESCKKWASLSSKAFSSARKSRYGNKSFDTAPSQSESQCTGDSEDQQKLDNVEPPDQRRSFVNGRRSHCMSGKARTCLTSKTACVKSSITANDKAHLDTEVDGREMPLNGISVKSDLEWNSTALSDVSSQDSRVCRMSPSS